MTVRLVGYQPQYFPRLHYYARILNADIFKVSDNLQYVRRHAYPSSDGTVHNGPSYQAHSPVKTSQGMYLLEIPTRHRGELRQRTLDTVALDYLSGWHEKHLRTIEINYAKAPQFKELFPGLAGLLMREYANLAACTIATTVWGIAILLEIPVSSLESFTIAEIMPALSLSQFRLRNIVRMSESGLSPADKDAGQDVNAWLIEQSRSLGADEYYFGGTAATAYIDQERLKEAGLTLIQQDWKCDEYPQQFPKRGFLPNLSIIDLLMNVTPAEARRIVSTPNQ